MRPGLAVLGLLSLACAPAKQDAPAQKPVPVKLDEQSEDELAKVASPKAAQPRYPQGIVNPLAGAFKRFDGFHLASAIWPRLSRFHAQIDQDDRSRGVLIGHLVTYQSGSEQGSPKGEVDAIILYGTRQDAPTRGYRVASFRTVAEPPGPLELIAASSEDGLSVAATARLNLRREGGQLIVEIHEENSVATRSFQRLDKNWALQPLGSAKTTF